MKTIFYLNGRKITRKTVKENVGEERLKRMLSDAKEAFFDDSNAELSYMVQGGMLTIEFT